MKAGVYYIWRDFIDFIVENKFKLIFILLVGIIGCGFGIAGAVSATNITVISSININRLNIIVFAQGKRGIVGYFFFHFISTAIVLCIMILLSYRFYLAFFNIVILFFFCMIYARALAAILLVFKLTFFPVVIIGLIPPFILFFCVFCCFTAYSFQKSYEFKYYGYNNYFYCIGHLAVRSALFCIILIVICIIQTILVAILSLGIIL